MVGSVPSRTSMPPGTPSLAGPPPVNRLQSPSLTQPTSTPERTAESYRSPAQTGSKPIDVQSEASSVSATIASSNPEQVDANASRLSGLNLELANKLNSLRPASQHQVLTLTEEVTDFNDAVSNDQYRSASQSGISSKGKVGSTFGRSTPLKPGGTVDVVGHGSADGKTVGGKTPQQLAKLLKDGGATQLAVLDLKSCYSDAFKVELEQCLKDVGIEVGEIKTYKGSVAVSRATGEVMQGDDLEKMDGHDGILPRETDLREPRDEFTLVDKWLINAGDWDDEKDRAKDEALHTLTKLNFGQVKAALDSPSNRENQAVLRGLGIALNQESTARFSNRVIDNILRKMEIPSVKEDLIAEVTPFILGREAQGKSQAYGRASLQDASGRKIPVPAGLIRRESGGRPHDLSRHSRLVHFDLGHAHNDRSTDAEAHILREIDGFISKYRIKPESIRGSIEIVTDRKTCISCVAMCSEFAKKYPNIDLRVSFYNDVDMSQAKLLHRQEALVQRQAPQASRGIPETDEKELSSQASQPDLVASSSAHVDTSSEDLVDSGSVVSQASQEPLTWADRFKLQTNKNT